MSNLETFQSNIQLFVISNILNPLSEWLSNEKKVSVTIDELLEVLRIPRSTSTPRNSVPLVLNSTPLNVSSPISTNLAQTTITGGVVKAKPKSKPPSKEKVAETSSETFGTCKYVFKRGELKGKECGKGLKSSDSEYCEQCNKKVTKPSEAKTTDGADVKPKDKPEPTKKTTTETKPVGFTTPIAKKAEKLKVELREAGGQPNTYIDIQTNIVVKKVMDGEKAVYVAVGVQEENGFRTLTEDEKKDAMKRGFSLQNPTSSEVKAKPKAVNGIPDIDSDNE
jgi:hypothetical protein